MGPTPKRTRSRWDETPLIRAGAAGDPNATPLGAGAFDGGATPGPGQLAGMVTPDIHGLAAQHMAAANVPMTPEQYNAMRHTSARLRRGTRRSRTRTWT